MLSAAQLRIIRRFWAGFLGCSEEQLLQPGVHVVRHGGLTGYAGIWAFRVGDSLQISVPESQVAVVQEAAAGSACDQLYCRERLIALVGSGQVERIIGPCFVGYLGRESFRLPQGPVICRLMTGNDLDQVEELRLACGSDWDIGGVDFDAHEAVFGCFDADQLVAAASYELWGRQIAHICVFTAPEFRQRGFARSVAASATAHALSRGLLPQWRTECSNTSALAIAGALGFEDFASHYALRLNIKP